MTIMFVIKNVPGIFTTDPTLVAGSKQITKGSFVRLPSGAIYKYVQDNPTRFVLFREDEVPTGTDILNAIEFDIS